MAEKSVAEDVFIEMDTAQFADAGNFRGVPRLPENKTAVLKNSSLSPALSAPQNFMVTDDDIVTISPEETEKPIVDFLLFFPPHAGGDPLFRQNADHRSMHQAVQFHWSHGDRMGCRNRDGVGDLLIVQNRSSAGKSANLRKVLEPLWEFFTLFFLKIPQA